MSRRRRGESDQAPDPEAETSTTVGEGPQIEVKMKGNADEVKAQLGVSVPEAPEKPRTTRAEELAESNEQFFRDLSNANFTVKVKRLRPKMWQGQKLLSEVWASELPLQLDEIKAEVTQLCGGGTYKVAVVDPSTDKMVSAKNFEGEGDPIVEQTDQTEIERIMMQGGPKDATTASVESLDRRAQVTAKMIEVESLEHQLEEARNVRNGGGKKNAPDDGRINDLERRLTETKHQAELEARDRRHQEEMKELKALIAQNQKPVQQGPSEITALITQMQKAQESSDKRFSDLMRQMQDDKMNQLLQKIDNLEKRPAKDKGDMVEMAESMLTLKKVFGWGGQDDDEDEDDPDDDRPWWQKALDKLGDKMTPKLIDKIFSKLEGIEGSGKTVTKDDFMKINHEEIEAHARRVADEEVKRIMDAEAARKPAALPPPAPNAPSAPLKTELPPPAPAQDAPPAAPAAPAAPQAAAMSFAQKLCHIAAGAIAAIEQELEFRPRNYEWNYQFFDNLPEDLLERVCVAPNPVDLFDAFKVEGIDVKGVDEIKAKISANLKMTAWLKLGFDELVEWKKKADLDPSFDPGAEEEDEPEQE